MPAADLASLKIHDTARSRGGAGKFWGFFAAGLGVLLLVAGGVFALKNRAPVVEVAVARPAGDPAQQVALNASGYVTPRRKATIAAKITGRVTGVFFDEGDHVKEGQLLATLDDSDVRRALESAVADRDSSKAAIQDFEVQLRYAEIQLHRATELKAANVQSQDQLDNAVTAADSLKAKIAL
ncbi:MAG TPA: biotin/lipoyl-binding protein, partial [Candidatus Acidoferrum sp.]